MTPQSYGSVVAMEFKARPEIDFAEIVEDFDMAFQMVDTRSRALTWENDETAIIDRDYVRVAMGWLPAKETGQPWHLIIAVGSSPDEDLSKIEMSSYEFLADRILDRTSEFLPSTAVLRGNASQPIGPDLMETLSSLLETDVTDMASDTGLRDVDTRQPFAEEYADMVDSMSPPWAHTDYCGGLYSKAKFDAAELAAQAVDNDAMEFASGRFRLGGAGSSEPMRLTIHTLALSMCLYVPPLGAAMFAYTMMRDVFPMAT